MEAWSDNPGLFSNQGIDSTLILTEKNTPEIKLN